MVLLLIGSSALPELCPFLLCGEHIPMTIGLSSWYGFNTQMVSTQTVQSKRTGTVSYVGRVIKSINPEILTTSK